MFRAVQARYNKINTDRNRMMLNMMNGQIYVQEGRAQVGALPENAIRHLADSEEWFVCFHVQQELLMGEKANVPLLRMDNVFISAGRDSASSSRAHILRAEDVWHVELIVPQNNANYDGFFAVSYHRNRYLTVFAEGSLAEFVSDRSRPLHIAENPKPRFEILGAVRNLMIYSRIPTFTERYRLFRRLGQAFGTDWIACPVYQYYDAILSHPHASLRDPSEIITVGTRRYVYFTYVEQEEDGFRGSIFVSSSSIDDDPSCPESWSLPMEVIPKGDPAKDHDGTGCFTPDCHFDGSRVHVFYTGLHSTHPRGFPQWEEKREPEHIMVARSVLPDRGFVKASKDRTIAETRELGYHEATVPGGHVAREGKALYDVSLIDHGQCWVMDDGERRYYYKGGGGSEKHKGAVCLIRCLDENWLNGYRHSSEPVLQASGLHMEGILITRVDDTLFMQLQLFDDERRWITYTSPSSDGLSWTYRGGGHYPKPGERYPNSIGVCGTIEPDWAIGQFPGKHGWIELAYLRVL